MFRMCGVFAEFERSIIRERIGAGLARPKANGKQLGRPKVDPVVEVAIRDVLERGDKGVRRIVGEMGYAIRVFCYASNACHFPSSKLYRVPVQDQR